jgi:hypothetical protein
MFAIFKGSEPETRRLQSSANPMARVWLFSKADKRSSKARFQTT